MNNIISNNPGKRSLAYMMPQSDGGKVRDVKGVVLVQDSTYQLTLQRSLWDPVPLNKLYDY